MRTSRKPSLRQKLMSIITLTSSLVLLLACAAFVAYDSITFRRELASRISIMAEATARNCTSALDFNDRRTAEEALTALDADPHILSACIYSRDGKVFAVYRKDRNAAFAAPAIQSDGPQFRHDQLHLFRSIFRDNEKLGTLFVAADLKELTKRLERYTTIVALVFIASLLVTLILSHSLQRLVSDPILRLAKLARSVALEKNYSVRVEKRSEDELGVLVDGFNEMLTQIQTRDTALSGEVQTRQRAESELRHSLELAEHSRLAMLNAMEKQKRAQEELRSTHAQLEQMLTHSPAVIYRLKIEGQQLRPMTVSENITRLLGFSQEEALNDKWWLGQLHPDDRERVLASVPDMFKQHSFRCDYRICDKNGTYLWIEDNVRVLRDSTGTPSEIVGVWMDVTERKTLEAQLIQSQKMETVGKLAGGVAHEFNNILTAIIGQSELILNDLPTGNPLSKNVSEIRRAADRAAALTRQLLAYGRKQLLQAEVMDLNTILANMQTILPPLMGGNVTVRVVPKVGFSAVKADIGQIEQVIINLAINARDAMPQGGKLVLEASNVTITPDTVGRDIDLTPGCYVMLAISDTGIGMSSEIQQHVFEPFFTTKGVGQGTGLGLATCYGIVKQSGGHITIYSEAGKGTTVKIYLPQVEPLNAAGAGAIPPDLPRGTETILLVEDDTALREMAAILLHRLGYNVMPAANGLNALSLIEQYGDKPIELLFTDVVMPQMDGKELADRLRTLHPETKTLFASAYTEAAIAHHGILDPDVALLQKPFTPSTLAHRIREILDGRNNEPTTRINGRP